MKGVAFGEEFAGTIGGNSFAQHDAEAGWDDNGDSAALGQMAKKLIAQNVRDGVHDYAVNGRFEFMVHDGKLCVTFCMYNSVESIRPFGRLGKLLDSVLEAAEKSPEGKEFYRLLLQEMQEFLHKVQAKHNRFGGGDEAPERPSSRRGARRQDSITDIDHEALRGRK